MTQVFKWLIVVLTLQVLFIETMSSYACPAPQTNPRQEPDQIAMTSRAQAILDLVTFAVRNRHQSTDFYEVAAPELLKLGPQAVPDLIEVLENAPLRSVELSLAIDTVSSLRDQRAIPALIELANSRNVAHHYGYGEFAKRLAQFGPVITPDLVQLASNGSNHGRLLAIEALLEMDAAEAEPIAERILKAETGRDLVLFSRALKYFVARNDSKLEPMLLKLIRGKLDAMSKKTTESENNQIRNQVTQLVLELGTTGSPKALGVLLKFVSDDESPYQQASIVALGKRKEPQAIDDLVRFLGDEPVANDAPDDPKICPSFEWPAPTRRQLAIAALTEIGEPVTYALTSVVQADRNSRTGHGAIEVLAALGNPDTRAVLEEILSDQTVDKLIRGKAALGLGLIKDWNSIPVLIEALDEQPPLRLGPSVVDALVAIGEPARAPLLKLLPAENYIVRGAAVEVLSHIGNEQDFPAVAKVASTVESDGYTFVEDFLVFAERIDSAESSDSLWRMAKNSGNGHKALRILAAREPVDRVRLERAIVAGFKNAKYDWQRYGLIEICDRIESAEIDEQLLLICEGEFVPGRDYAVQQALKVMGGRNTEQLLAHLNARAKGMPALQEAFYCGLIDCQDSPFAQKAVLAALDDPKFRQAAVKIIRLWKWKPAADRLLKMLEEAEQDKDTDLLLQVCYALSELREPRLIKWLLDNPVNYPERLIASFGPEATKDMIGAIDTHPKLANWVLTWVRDPKAIPHLQKQLEVDQFKREHFDIVTTLAEMGDQRGLELLTTRFMKPPGYSDHFTWESLKRCPRKKTRPYFKRLLESELYEARAIGTLTWFGTPADIELLRIHYPDASGDGKKLIESQLSSLGYSLDKSKR